MTDAKALKLVKAHKLTVRWDGGLHGEWTVRGWYEGRTGALSEEVRHDDLNTAVKECVQRMLRATVEKWPYPT